MGGGGAGCPLSCIEKPDLSKHSPFRPGRFLTETETHVLPGGWIYQRTLDFHVKLSSLNNNNETIFKLFKNVEKLR